MKLKEVDIPCLVKVQMTKVPKSVAKGLQTKMDVDELLENEVGEYYQEVLITGHVEDNKDDYHSKKKEEMETKENKIDVNINGVKNIMIMKYEGNCDFYYIPCFNKATGEKKFRIMRIKKVVMRIPNLKYNLEELYLESMENLKHECDRINIKYQVGEPELLQSPRSAKEGNQASTSYQDKTHKKLCMEIMNYYNRLVYDRVKLITDIYQKVNSSNKKVDMDEMMEMPDMSYTDDMGDEVEIYKKLLEEL